MPFSVGRYIDLTLPYIECCGLTPGHERFYGADDGVKML
jgi:hypothetical protein